MRGDQKVFQFDILSKKLIFFTVNCTQYRYFIVMYTDKMIASIVVMTSS